MRLCHKHNKRNPNSCHYYGRCYHTECENCPPCKVKHDMEDLYCELSNIQGYVDTICHKLSDPDYGLKHLCYDIHRLNSDIAQLQLAVNSISGLLNDPEYGLKQIKSDTEEIISTLNNPSYGLQETNFLVQAIYDYLLNPSFGAEELNLGIRNISEQLDELNERITNH